jgi:hypothetical protein
MTELEVRQHDLIGPAEEDQFGLFKDCPTTLKRHAVGVRAAIGGAEPGAVQQRPAPKQTSVSSPKGPWGVLVEGGPAPPKQWRIAAFPRS